MLNEFYDIAKSLKAAGIKTVPLDKRVKGPAKGAKLCFELAEEGIVSGVRIIPADVIKNSWTIKNGNKNSFPFVRLQDPMLAHEYDSQTIKDIKKRVFKVSVPVRHGCRVI